MPKTSVIDPGAGEPPAHPFKRWLLADLEIKGTQGPLSKHEAEHPWWKVMCLTGVVITVPDLSLGRVCKCSFMDNAPSWR